MKICWGVKFISIYLISRGVHLQPIAIDFRVQIWLRYLLYAVHFHLPLMWHQEFRLCCWILMRSGWSCKNKHQNVSDDVRISKNKNNKKNHKRRARRRWRRRRTTTKKEKGITDSTSKVSKKIYLFQFYSSLVSLLISKVLFIPPHAFLRLHLYLFSCIVQQDSYLLLFHLLFLWLSRLDFIVIILFIILRLNKSNQSSRQSLSQCTTLNFTLIFFFISFYFSFLIKFVLDSPTFETPYTGISCAYEGWFLLYLGIKCIYLVIAWMH